MAIFFTSDTHFAHRNSMRYCGRPFTTVEACDEAMVSRWNSVVRPEDTVYHLGDVSMHIKPIERLIPRLNGKKILIVGNHDLTYPYFAKTRGQKFVDEMQKRYLAAGFEDIHPSGVLLAFLNEKGESLFDVRLSHFPTKGFGDSHHDGKHQASMPTDDGRPNICGHVHQSWLKRGNNINVGVDVWDFTPVPLLKVVALWKRGPKNIETPHKLRIWFWQKYHTLRGHLETFFKTQEVRK